MALAKKCDRCGKLYEVYERGIDNARCNAVGTCHVDPLDRVTRRRDYDLCGDCLDSFSKWLHLNGDAK